MSAGVLLTGLIVGGLIGLLSAARSYRVVVESQRGLIAALRETETILHRRLVHADECLDRWSAIAVGRATKLSTVRHQRDVLKSQRDYYRSKCERLLVDSETLRTELQRRDSAV